MDVVLKGIRLLSFGMCMWCSLLFGVYQWFISNNFPTSCDIYLPRNWIFGGWSARASRETRQRGKDYTFARPTLPSGLSYLLDEWPESDSEPSSYLRESCPRRERFSFRDRRNTMRTESTSFRIEIKASITGRATSVLLWFGANRVYGQTTKQALSKPRQVDIIQPLSDTHNIFLKLFRLSILCSTGSSADILRGAWATTVVVGRDEQLRSFEFSSSTLCHFAKPAIMILYKWNKRVFQQCNDEVSQSH